MNRISWCEGMMLSWNLAIIVHFSLIYDNAIKALDTDTCIGTLLEHVHRNAPGRISLHMASSWYEFSWYIIFVDETIILMLWHILCEKFNDSFASVMLSRHIISDTNYTVDLSTWT